MYFKGLNIFFSDCLALCLTQFIKLGLEGGEGNFVRIKLIVCSDVGCVVIRVGSLEVKTKFGTFGRVSV